jgi:hypothetical protein
MELFIFYNKPQQTEDLPGIIPAIREFFNDI